MKIYNGIWHTETDCCNNSRELDGFRKKKAHTHMCRLVLKHTHTCVCTHSKWAVCVHTHTAVALIMLTCLYPVNNETWFCFDAVSCWTLRRPQTRHTHTRTHRGVFSATQWVGSLLHFAGRKETAVKCSLEASLACCYSRSLIIINLSINVPSLTFSVQHCWDKRRARARAKRCNCVETLAAPSCSSEG